MACERIADDLKAHAAGTEASRRLRAHLDGCAECRARLAHERQLVASVEGDLAAALGVKPSVEFEARIRQRVAEENPAEAGSHWAMAAAWRLALSAASLVLLAGLTIVLVSRTNRPPQSATTTTRARTNAVAAAPVPTQRGVTGTPDAVASIPGRRPAVGNVRKPPRASLAAREPEVLVPPDQRMALNRLVEMVRTGRIDERMFPPAAEPVAAPLAQVVAPIVVDELKVPPIEVSAAGSTEKKELERIRRP